MQFNLKKISLLLILSILSPLVFAHEGKQCDVSNFSDQKPHVTTFQNGLDWSTSLSFSVNQVHWNLSEYVFNGSSKELSNKGFLGLTDPEKIDELWYSYFRYDKLENYIFQKTEHVDIVNLVSGIKVHIIDGTFQSKTDRHAVASVVDGESIYLYHVFSLTEDDVPLPNVNEMVVVVKRLINSCRSTQL